MGPIISLVDQATTSVIPGGGALPSPLLTAAHVVYKVHSLMTWQAQYFNILASASNLKKYIAGCIVGASPLGSSVILRSAAQVILVLRRITDCGKQKVVVYRCWIRLKDTWHVTYVTQVKVSLHLSPDQASVLERLLSPGAYIWLETNRQATMMFLSHALPCVKDLAWELLQLSICYRLVIEACSLDPSVRTAAVNEMFVHTSKLFDEIAENRATIHAELTANKALIQQILNLVGLNWTAEAFIASVGSTLSTAEYFYSGASSVYQSAENVVKDGLWTGMHSAIGWAPNILLPNPRA